MILPNSVNKYVITVSTSRQSHLVVTFVLSVVRVPYSDDYVSGAEVKIGVICDVVDADVLLDPDDLETKQET